MMFCFGTSCEVSGWLYVQVGRSVKFLLRLNVENLSMLSESLEG